MLFLLSPAKSLDYDTPLEPHPHTAPLFVKQSQALIALLRQQRECSHEHVKPLVRFDAADAHEQHIFGLQSQRAAQRLRPRSGFSSIAVRHLDGVRNNPYNVLADAEVCQ